MSSCTRLAPFILCVAAASAFAQSAEKPQAPDEVAVGTPLHYQVIEVTGKVRVAKFGTDPTSDTGWRPVKKGELLTAGLQIHTGLRSKVKLAAYPAEPPTVILLEQLTLVGINDLRFSGESGRMRAKSRIGLGYGAIRAGVAEGEVRSDMEIASPVATLSKKGTDIFRFEFRDNRWSMSLSPLGRGQIQAIQHRYSGIVGGRRWTGGPLVTRNVFAGQLVTQAMARTIDTTVSFRNINVRDIFGLEDIEIRFQNILGNGLGFKLLGQNLFGVQQGQDGEIQQDVQNQQVHNRMTNGLLLQDAINRLRGATGVRPNSGGDFGIGQIALPNPFGSPTLQKSTGISTLDRARLKVERKRAFAGRRGR